jgi:DNA-binding CsgD family transcriptional regulator
MGVLRVCSKPDERKPRHNWISSAPGLILIDSSFTPIACNQEGATILTYPHKPNLERIDMLPVPQEILAEMREHRLPKTLFLAIPFRAGKREYICHAFPISFGHLAPTQPVFALLLQRGSSVSEIVSKIAAQYRLTDREQEALQGIAAGLDNRRLATRMQISPNTVKAYLHLVMVKMGVTSRAGIVARILGHNSGARSKLMAADTVRTSAVEPRE